MRTVFFAFLMTIGFIADAQTFTSLDEFLAHSKKNNPALKAEGLNRQISEQRLKSAWSLLLPQVRAFGNIDNNVSLPVQLVPAQFLGGPEGTYAKVQFGTQFSSTYGAEATLSLVNASNWKNIRTSALAQEAAMFQYQDRELNLIEQIIAAYYFALLSREAIALNTELLHAADSLLSAAASRLQNGLIETLEYNRVKALYLETSQQLKESHGAYEKNINSLKAFANIPAKDSLVLTENIALAAKEPAPSKLNISWQQLPRFRMLTARADQSEAELSKQRMKALPEFSLFARYSRQAFNNEFKILSSGQQWFDVGVIGVRAEWNLFSGFNRQSTIRQSALQLSSSRFELENYTRLAEKELDELRINHEVAAQGLHEFSEHYALNMVNHRIAGEKYKEGVYSIDQYVTIYQEMVRSQNQYLNKLASYLVYESMVQSRNMLK